MLIKKTALMALSSVIRLFSTLIVFVILARKLGPQDFGLITYNFALASLVILIVEYGFSIQVLKGISSKAAESHSIVSLAFFSKLLLTFLSFLVVILLILIPGELIKNIGLFFTFYLALILFSFADLFNIAYRAEGLFQLETKNITFASVLHFVTVVSVLIFTSDLILIGFSFVIARFIYFVFALHRYFTFSGKSSFAKVSLGNTLTYTKNGFIYAIDGLVTNFFYQIDSIFVKMYLGISTLGLYQAAIKFLQGTMQFAPVLANVFIPAITESLNSQSLLEKRTRNLSNSMFYFGLLAGTSLMIVGKPLGDIVYGSKYTIGQEVWIALGLLVFMRFLSGSIGTILISLGNQLQRVACQIISTILLLAISPTFIQKFGMVGMLFSLQVSVLFTFLLYFILTVKNKIYTGFDVYKLALTAIVLLIGFNFEF